MASIRELITESILGYIFWTLYQALAPMIWFYPLNELEISGYEAFVTFMLSPILLGIPAVRRLCVSRAGLAVLRLVALGAVGSLQAPTTLQRLVTLSVGCAAVMLVFTLSLFAENQRYRTLTLWGHLLGLVAFVASRVWYVSFVPAWWDQVSNSAVIAVGAIATLDKIINGCSISSESQPSSASKASDKSKEADPKSSSDPEPNWLLTGVGLGSLLFLTIWVLGEVSLVCRWTVTGFPDTGPQPYPWGAVVLLAMWLGVELSPCRHVTRTTVWWLVGCGSIAALYYLNTWTAFWGGVILSVYIMSMWPELLDRVTRCPAARTITLAALVWTVQTLYTVWTVAYNFVPGGVYTRERTDLLIAGVMISIGAATLTRRPKLDNPSKTAFAQIDGVKMPCKNTSRLLLLIILIGCGGFIYRYPYQTRIHPEKVQPKADFSAAIWTFHFGYDNLGWQSMDRAAELLKNTGADVITLLESDASKSFLGNNDLGLWLAERLAMYVDFGPSTRDHTWGNLILSKYPIVKSKHHLLPSPHGELAPAITATINMTGHLVDFVTTHMGNDRDRLDRKLQAQVLAEELHQADNPVVFMGYVTSNPFSRDYTQLTSKGRVQDIDKTDKDRFCEYILYRGLIRLGYARISHGGLSDTEIQMARFRIPEDPDSFQDHTVRTNKASKVDPEDRFNPVFGPHQKFHNYAPGHRFHMNTPTYFIEK